MVGLHESQWYLQSGVGFKSNEIWKSFTEIPWCKAPWCKPVMYKPQSNILTLSPSACSYLWNWSSLLFIMTLQIWDCSLCFIFEVSNISFSDSQLTVAVKGWGPFHWTNGFFLTVLCFDGEQRNLHLHRSIHKQIHANSKADFIETTSYLCCGL